MIHNDMLQAMFIEQEALQIQLGVKPKFMDQQYIKDMTLAAIVELTEVLNETPWKPWKKDQHLRSENIENYQQEIADVMHFLINLCIVADIDATTLHDLYMAKNKINQQRHQEGY